MEKAARSQFCSNREAEANIFAPEAATMERKEAGMWRWENHRTVRTMQYGALGVSLRGSSAATEYGPLIPGKLLDASGLRHQVLIARLSNYVNRPPIPQVSRN
jgi:hypothetical protein